MMTRMYCLYISFGYLFVLSSGTYDSNCPSWYKAETGTFSSHPQFAPRPMTCYWSFTVPEQDIYFTLEDYFSIDTGCSLIQVLDDTGADTLHDHPCDSPYRNILVKSKTSLLVEIHINRWRPTFRAKIRTVPSTRAQLTISPVPTTWTVGKSVCQTGGIKGHSQGQMYQVKDIPSVQLDDLDPTQVGPEGVWVGRYMTPWLKMNGCFSLTDLASDDRDIAVEHNWECAILCKSSSYTFFGIKNNQCKCLVDINGYLGSELPLRDCCTGNEKQPCVVSDAKNYMLYEIDAILYNIDQGSPDDRKCQKWDGDSFFKTYCDQQLQASCSTQNTFVETDSYGSWQTIMDGCRDAGAKYYYPEKRTYETVVNESVWTALIRGETLLSESDVHFTPANCFYMASSSDPDIPSKWHVDVANCNETKRVLCQYPERETTGMIITGNTTPVTATSDLTPGANNSVGAKKDGASENDDMNWGTAVAAILGVCLLVLVVAISVAVIIRRRKRGQVPKGRVMDNRTYGLGTFTSIAEEPPVLQQTPLNGQRDYENMSGSPRDPLYVNQFGVMTKPKDHASNITGSLDRNNSIKESNSDYEVPINEDHHDAAGYIHPVSTIADGTSDIYEDPDKPKSYGVYEDLEKNRKEEHKYQTFSAGASKQNQSDDMYYEIK